jgi:hypothetical protein
LISHSFLLDKFSSYGFPTGYVNWFCNYLTNRLCYISFLRIFSSPFIALSGVTQGSVVGPLFSNIYINDLCCKITYSNVLLFSDDITVFRHTTSIDDCLLLQSDTNCFKYWCTANYMKISAGKRRVISLSRKTYLLTLTASFITQIFCVQIVLKTMVSFLTPDFTSISMLTTCSLIH